MRKFLVLVMALIAPGCASQGGPNGNDCVEVCTPEGCSTECEDRFVLNLTNYHVQHCVDYNNPVNPNTNWDCYGEEPEAPSCDLLTLEYDLGDPVTVSPCQAPKNECTRRSAEGRSVMETLGGCFVPAHYKDCLGGSNLVDVLNGSLCN